MNKLLSTVLALFVTSVTASTVLAQDIKGDAKAGAGKIASCIGCHGIKGYQASFPEIYRVPMISGQNGKYIAASLAAYKKGDRRHPTMRAIAGSLSEQDMADLAAFYESHGASGPVKTVSDTPAEAPSAEVGALLTKGACVSCHGANFNKPIDPAYPKLAGQPADYLYAALKAYQIEGNPNVGRANAIMAAQVKQFKLAELKAIAGYLSKLPGDVKVVERPKFH